MVLLRFSTKIGFFLDMLWLLIVGGTVEYSPGAITQ